MNTKALKSRIVEAGMTQACLAAKLGISRSALNRKLNNRGTFTIAEVVLICMQLALNKPAAIFLPPSSQMCNDRAEAALK